MNDNNLPNVVLSPQIPLAHPFQTQHIIAEVRSPSVLAQPASSLISLLNTLLEWQAPPSHLVRLSLIRVMGKDIPCSRDALLLGKSRERE